MLKRLAAVILCYRSRRLLWLWGATYLVIVGSEFLFPLSSGQSEFDYTSAVSVRAAARGDQNEARLKAACPLLGFAGQHDLVVDLRVGRTLDDGCISAIRASPSVHRLFVGGYRKRSAEFRHLSEALPRIEVWHLEFSGMRIAGAFYLMFTLLTLAGGMIQQIQANFSLPQARLFPRYSLPHLLLPLTILGAGIVVQAGLFRAFGLDFWAAATIQIFACGTCAVLELLYANVAQVAWPPPGSKASLATRARRSIGGILSRLLRGLPLIVVVATIAGSYFAITRYPYVLESLLLGEMPRTNFAIFLTGITMIGVGAALAPRLIVGNNERGSASPLFPRQSEQRRSPFAVPEVGGMQRRLDRLSRRSRRPAWLWRIRAVRSGMPATLVSNLLWICVLAALIGLFRYCTPALLPRHTLTDVSAVFDIFVLVIGYFVMTLNFFGNWWERRKAFSLEILYPWTRRQITLAAFGAYAVDVGVILILFSCVVIACKIGFGWQLSFPLIVMGLLAAASIAAVLSAGALGLLSLHHGWFAGLLCLVGVTVWGIVAQVSATSIILEGHFLSSLSSVAIKCAVIAILLSVAVYRRWMRVEWGRIGPS